MVEFQTKYDKDIIKKASIYSTHQILIPLLVVSLGFLILSIVNFADHNIAVGIIWLVLTFVYIPFTYFITYFSQITKYANMYLKDNGEKIQPVDTYTFDKKSIKFSTDAGTKNISSEITDYDYFIKVKEKRDEFISYKTKTQICIIPKNSLTKGTIKEFKELLAEHYGKI